MNWMLFDFDTLQTRQVVKINVAFGLPFQSFLGEREWSHVNKLTNQKQFWFLLSGGKNASFPTCWGATQRLPGCNSGIEPALLPFT